jgi:BirA family biotin operon repressor/biotin-[acetyl-CoA-carboxylase] ligase
MASQSAGRGRMGRLWQSPPGHVYGALRLPLAPPFDGPGAALALSLFLAGALGDFGWALSLKWPNDLIFNGGKTGGILLEARSGILLAGVGLNLLAPPEGDWRLARDPGTPPPAALPYPHGPRALWKALVKKIIMLYSCRLGFWTMAELGREAEKILWGRGEKVYVLRPAAEPPVTAERLTGRLAGLGPAGQLLVEDSGGGRRQIWSGTVGLE